MDDDRAQLQFEIENGIEILDAATDAIYEYNREEQCKINEAQPWKTDPNHFAKAKISAVALIKMAGSIEVMGLMQGKIRGDTFIIMDAFPLPVEGTETRVNAAAEAYEYMGDYLETVQKINKPENVVGWWQVSGIAYAEARHSHPGYGCWLSGIDVNTQFQNQQFQDPWLALVVGAAAGGLIAD
ncbi:COP9 signalosome complex subunit 5b [Neolecta irregularis DAH-3]|uniref:COP9 signalosome complex subunit 5 n=1 Tax=Neolecta irregularis (strain DAH-3) TaxID=1198029 RepID=A0A1U7LKA8_NEOID|nr:COP9 signalosome complex subunit 5b [Neolecta irregularis DAH-3]|eukprot:OLL23068.1 COP9 signalosome complex subunit 5b [Neolecta irregularis DAH-3]